MRRSVAVTVEETSGYCVRCSVSNTERDVSSVATADGAGRCICFFIISPFNEIHLYFYIFYTLSSLN